jgi:hypothetical protein
MLTMRSMRVSSSGSQEGSKIYFGPQAEFSIGTDAAANFVVQKASDPFIALDNQDNLHLIAKLVQASSVDVKGSISVRGVKQWQLVHGEDFAFQAQGWSRTDVSTCAGVHMLGGYCKFSKGEVTKIFAGLPEHKQLRIVATFHFLDRWIGESGYMKLSLGQSGTPVVVWSEQHAQGPSKNGLNICGAATPEGKFSVPIDVTVPHTDETVQLAFGSTMDDADPCDESWGVSGIELYIRD